MIKCPKCKGHGTLTNSGEVIPWYWRFLELITISYWYYRSCNKCHGVGHVKF